MDLLDLNDQQKTILVSYIDRTSKLIPFLTSEELMEMDTKIKLQEITEANKTSKYQISKRKIIHLRQMLKKLKDKNLLMNKVAGELSTIDSGTGYN